jgi:hypothetical protein
LKLLDWAAAIYSWLRNGEKHSTKSLSFDNGLNLKFADVLDVVFLRPRDGEQISGSLELFPEKAEANRHRGNPEPARFLENGAG